MSEQKDTVAGAAAEETVNQPAQPSPAVTDVAGVEGGPAETQPSAQEAPAADAKGEVVAETPAAAPAAPAVITPPASKEEKKDEKKEEKSNDKEQKPTVDYMSAEDVISFLKLKYKNFDESNIPATVAATIEKMEVYIKSMGPTVANGAATGSANQRSLYYTFMNALSAPDADIRMNLDVVNYFFYKHRDGAMGPRLVFRYLEALKLSKEEVNAFQTLVHIFVTTCDPKGRAAGLKTIDMDRAVNQVIEIRHRERLMSYYIHK